MWRRMEVRRVKGYVFNQLPSDQENCALIPGPTAGSPAGFVGSDKIRRAKTHQTIPPRRRAGGTLVFFGNSVNRGLGEISKIPRKETFFIYLEILPSFFHRDRSSFIGFANPARTEEWLQWARSALRFGAAIIVTHLNQPLSELTEFDRAVAQALFKEFGDLVGIVIPREPAVSTGHTPAGSSERIFL